MQYIILATMVVVMSASYLVELKVAPQPFKFLPELFTIVVAVFVVAAGIKTRFEQVRPAYWFFLGGVTIIIFCGILANSVGTGPIIAGLRYYLRAIPFFLLPAVYAFQNRQIKQQINLLLFFAFLQIPLAIYQRYALLQESRFTGDFVYGTLMLSPTLTLFMLSCISLVTAMVLKQRIGKVLFGALFVCFLIPISINETKVSIFLLPMVLVIVTMTAAERGKRLKMIGVASLALAMAAAIFIPVYDYLGSQNISTEESSKVSDIFLKKDFLKNYLDSGSEVGTTKKEVGRVDALVVPLSVITKDPVLTAFGYGIGNTSLSALGAQFSGDHAALLSLYSSSTTAATLILELGLLGTLCALGLHWLIWRDSLIVGRQSDDIVGSIALAWPAIVLLVTVTFLYTPSFYFESITYLFWYFSGVIAARRMQLAAQRRDQQRATNAAAPRHSSTPRAFLR